MSPPIEGADLSRLHYRTLPTNHQSSYSMEQHLRLLVHPVFGSILKGLLIFQPDGCLLLSTWNFPPKRLASCFDFLTGLLLVQVRLADFCLVVVVNDRNV